ncbi:hypothetical protein TMatcc_001296 [Talaromyces marneffei ATCC 18224]|uniref:uncharacterized protein n=1 Tax=Talaromyces marneffei TaxID=37727 RepID=UPI0012A8E57B|nr:uncharacterized protein EYB26_007465 [Talaromyces marneffei]KAE8551353.1 hypothetical protein EYB25_005238 [Talaromyces marneffei]QGA19771.1 hypothetical protein EYB26_007465 [Talaromyces marneffei]
MVATEIRRYSRVIKGILESIQDAEPLLAEKRHGRIKQAVLDAHATELQMFTAEYGEKAGQFCTQLCQGPLFNQISGETLEGVSQQTQIIAVMITTSASENDPMEDNMSTASEESCAVRIPDTEPETERLKEDISTNGKEKWRLVVSPSSGSDNTLTPTDEGEMMYSLPGTLNLIQPRH